MLLVRRLDPWAVPAEATYKRLHALIDSFDAQRPSMAFSMAQPSLHLASIMPSPGTGTGDHILGLAAPSLTGCKRSLAAFQELSMHQVSTDAVGLHCCIRSQVSAGSVPCLCLGFNTFLPAQSAPIKVQLLLCHPGFQAHAAEHSMKW